MSLQSWKREFYPQPANETFIITALEHSIQKWKGLRKKNLKKHHLKKICGGFYISEIDGNGDKFYFDDKTCALCHHFIKDGCSKCPLYRLNYNIPNNKSTTYNNFDMGVFDKGFKHPKIMLAKLRKCRSIYYAIIQQCMGNPAHITELEKKYSLLGPILKK